MAWKISYPNCAKSCAYILTYFFSFFSKQRRNPGWWSYTPFLWLLYNAIYSKYLYDIRTASLGPECAKFGLIYCSYLFSWSARNTTFVQFLFCSFICPIQWYCLYHGPQEIRPQSHPLPPTLLHLFPTTWFSSYLLVGVRYKIPERKWSRVFKPQSRVPNQYLCYCRIHRVCWRKKSGKHIYLFLSFLLCLLVCKESHWLRQRPWQFLHGTGEHKEAIRIAGLVFTLFNFAMERNQPKVLEHHPTAPRTPHPTSTTHRSAQTHNKSIRFGHSLYYCNCKFRASYSLVIIVLHVAFSCTSRSLAIITLRFTF
jgi:hypothetical protein